MNENDLTAMTKRLVELREAAYSANTGEVWNAATKAWRDFTFANATAIHAAAVELEQQLERITAELAAERAGAAGLREVIARRADSAKQCAERMFAANPISRRVDFLDHEAKVLRELLEVELPNAGRDTLAELERLRGENGKFKTMLVDFCGEAAAVALEHELPVTHSLVETHERIFAALTADAKAVSP
jgi:hypothetical protein